MDKRSGAKNILYGIGSQLITFAVGIIIPRLVLVNLGSEANGLLNSVGSVLTYLSLLEAGVGTASLQALYKPCAEKDYGSINSIMSATDYFYRRTGKIYSLIVIALSIGYTVLVKTSLPKLEVFTVIFLSGMSGVLSYFFQGKLRILLAAEGRSYIVTNITTIIHVFTNIAKAVLLYTGFSVGIVQTSNFVFTLIQILVYELYKKKQYPWLDCRVKPNFDAISQKNAVLVHQITYLIFNNTDVLILTVFTSLKEVSVYSMYAMIYGMVKAIAVNLYEGYTYAIGQAYYTDKAKFTHMINAYEVISILTTFSLYCVCRVLMLPFLRLYTFGINDINYIDPYLPWLFSAFYLLHNARTSSATVINISQHFEDTKWRSVLESAINLIVSLICVSKFGIYGVLMGTIAALLYRTNDMIIYASRILNRSCWITYKRWFLNLAIFFSLSFALDQFALPAENYLQLVLTAIVVSIVVIGVFVAINALVERESTRYVINIAKNMLNTVKRRFKKSSAA